MFGRGKNPTLMKPKKIHSLEYLKYLHSVLQKNSTVTDSNCELVVEAVRSIAEILIWGDQNDSAVMDFFLEKNMLDDFMKYLRQNTGRVLCVQVLQTLNILFENISNQTAIYYLLSSNYTNEIITHRFDFSDEEVVAYYVSFLKTLSLRLNSDTIHFFYFEQRHEFDLYVEAIKLFCHPENMVRIAVRTITLNIHRVKDEGALEFIHHQISVPYFSYLVWSIGNTVLDIDALVRADCGVPTTDQNYCKLGDLVAEHIDHLHYVNDLLTLDIGEINEVLCDQLLHRLLIPLHVYSLTKRYKAVGSKTSVSRPHVCNPVATLMLIHFYLIIKNPDVLNILTEAIFFGDPSLTDMIPYANHHLPTTREPGDSDNFDQTAKGSRGDLSSSELDAFTDDMDPTVAIAESLITANLAMRNARAAVVGERLSTYIKWGRSLHRQPAFLQPCESLEASLRHAKGVTGALLSSLWPSSLESLPPSSPPPESTLSLSTVKETSTIDLQENLDSTNSQLGQHSFETVVDNPMTSLNLQGRPFLRALFRTLEIGPGNDYDTLFTLLLLQAIRKNKAIDTDTLRLIHLTSPNSDNGQKYDNSIVSKLLDIVRDACKSGSRVRLVTLHVAIQLITQLVCGVSDRCHLSDEHFAYLISAREEAMLVLRSYFQNDAIFLDVFEHELRHIRDILVPLEKLALDVNLLLPPRISTVSNSARSPTHSSPVSGSGRSAQVPMTRVERYKRLPQSHIEHTEHAITVYLLVHIWLESLLRVRSCGENQISESASGSVDSSNGQLFSSNLPTDLSTIPGLAGLGDVPDPKVTLIHKAGDKLDLSSEALIRCTVERKGSYEKRFLVNYSQQLVLVEPDSKQMGWGVITFIGPLQDLEAICDPADSRCLHVNINPPGHLSSGGHTDHPGDDSQRLSFKPLLCARFLFEDHIRCMTARQMLLRGRELARQTKLRKIATLLDFSPEFIRDTFSVGAGYGSSSGKVSMNRTNHALSFNRFEAQNIVHSSDLSTGRGSRGIGLTTGRQTLVNHDPGTFLLERQNRLRANRTFPDGDLSEGRLTLVSLADRALRSGSKQDSNSVNNVSQGKSSWPAHHRTTPYSVPSQTQPLFQQSITSDLLPPKFTIIPPPEEGARLASTAFSLPDSNAPNPSSPSDQINQPTAAPK